MKKSHLKKILVTFIVGQLLVASQVSASLIVVSGDSSITFDLGGATSGDNDTFFLNILNGTTVKIQNDDPINLLNTASNINDFYNAQTGIASSIVTAGSVIDDAMLVGVDLYFSIVPSDDYSSSELDSLFNYVAGGGSIFFMGEWTSYGAAPNPRINTALTSLGSSMSIITDFISNGAFITTGIDPDPLTVGVDSFRYGGTSEVTGGTSLIHATEGTTFIAYETGIAPTVPVPAAIWLFGSGLVALIGVARRKT